MTALNVAVAIGVILVTMLVLVVFHATVQPDVRGFRAAFPFEAMGGVMMAGAIFAIVNATLEELVFRGLLFDALESQWGVLLALVATAVLFGFVHLHGYPAGVLGACLAGGFGFAMGVVRIWTGGLVLPIIAHVGADATIYGILVYSGAI